MFGARADTSSPFPSNGGWYSSRTTVSEGVGSMGNFSTAIDGLCGSGHATRTPQRESRAFIASFIPAFRGLQTVPAEIIVVLFSFDCEALPGVLRK